MARPKLRTSEGLWLAPGKVFTYHEEYWPQWQYGIVVAGRAGNEVLYAGCNARPLPDFCGGKMMGCLNYGTRPYNPGSPEHVALPEIPEVPDDIHAHFRATGDERRGWDRKFDWLAISLWHYIIAHGQYHIGGGMWHLFDRVHGPTLKRTIEAISVLKGRALWATYECGYGKDNYMGGYTPGYSLGKDYVNTNSGNRVQSLGVLLKRTPGSNLRSTAPEVPYQSKMGVTKRTYGLSAPIHIEHPFYAQ